MDKTEYKIRAEEIKSLIRAQRYADAVKIADTIDWKRVKSVGMLCAISDLYKVNRRLEESRDILLLAYDRSPTRREIVYSLCELAIAMGEFVQAVEYYKEFVRLAPRNTARYILQYKLYEAQEVSLEERIAVLEEYKKHDYNEKWAYELAYLYHRVGLTTECIEECDELFLYMRQGRYVMKALELKALHEPLSPEQKAVYNKYKMESSGVVTAPEMPAARVGVDEPENQKTPTKEIPPIPENFEAGDLAQDQYQREEYPAEQYQQDGYSQDEYQQQDYQQGYEEVYPESEAAYASEGQYQGEYAESPQVQYAEAPASEPAEEPEPVQRFTVPTVNVSNYNTVDLQKEIAENLKEVLIENPEAALFRDANGPGIVKEDDEVVDSPTMSEIFYEDSDVKATETKIWGAQEVKAEEDGTPSFMRRAEERPSEPARKTPIADELKDKEIVNSIAASTMNEHSMYKGAVYMDEPLQDEVPGAVIKPNARYQVNSHFDKMLSQEYDGQISMAIDEKKQVDDQITGQISISDFMSDWEAFKKNQQKKQLQNVKKLMASETGELFKDVDLSLEESLIPEDEEADDLPEIILSKSNMNQGTLVKETVEETEEAQEAAEPEEEIEDVPVLETAKAFVADAINAPKEEASQEIEAVNDLQNTQSMVMITGEDLETVAYKKKANEAMEEETSEAEEPSYEENIESIDEAAEEGSEESAKEAEEKEEVSDFKLGETTVIESSEIEEKLAETESQAAEDTSDEDSKEDSKKEDSKEEKAEAKESDSEKPETKKNKNKSKKAEAKKAESKKPSGDTEEINEAEDKGMEDRVRVMTPEEKELFGPYIHHRKSRKQIIQAIDNLSMAAYTNNAVVTGEEGAGTVDLAKGLIKAAQATDTNFSGKVAMISAITLNKRTVSPVFDKIVNGALIIRRAADLKENTIQTLLKLLQDENKGYIVVLEDTKDDIDRLFDKYPDLKNCFNVRVDIEALDDDSLVAYAKQYAIEKEHVIDNLGILALHQKISERQTLDHEVTVAEVKDMVDDAIYYADKRSIGHVVDVLFRKRFDEEDMIILREKDFLH